MVISPPSTLSTCPLAASPLVSSQSLSAPSTASISSPPTTSSPEPSVVQSIPQSSTLTHQTDQKSTTNVISHQHARYLHTDPQLNAELTFYSESLIWVLCYYRSDQQVGCSLYQSRATAELLLKSLGYRSAQLEEESA